MKDRKEINQIKRRNAKIFPIYKMFSWDLLFFYSIQFLFYTITKKISASDVLIINGLFLFYRIIMQIPSVTLTDTIGKKKSIVLGNISLVIYILLLINLKGAIGIMIANIFWAFGYDIKLLSETGLLYDSVSTRGGDGLYSKIDTKGGKWYYILDGIASMTAGYLFVINNYLPMYICLGFIIISTILSCFFKDVYKPKTENNNIIEYIKNLKKPFKFALKSRRMKSLILFNVVLYSLIKLIAVYNSDLLIEIGIPETQFSMIFAILTLLGGFSLSLKKSIEKTFKNRTLTFISLIYIFSCIFIGIIAKSFVGIGVVPIILFLFAMLQSITSIWYILETKYVKSFTNAKNRNQIVFVYESISGIAASIVSVLGGMLLKHINIQDSFIIVGLLGLLFMTLVLDYMRKRFGLKPDEYKKEDIEF